MPTDASRSADDECDLFVGIWHGEESVLRRVEGHVAPEELLLVANSKRRLRNACRHVIAVSIQSITSVNAYGAASAVHISCAARIRGIRMIRGLKGGGVVAISDRVRPC